MSKPAVKTCFVVCAIGAEGSPERSHADWVLEEIIEPVFEKHFPGFEVLRADRMATPGLIDAQVIDRLLNSELVIADLTFQNPNAFYEIGIRHVMAKPIVHIHLDGEKIPFDVSLFRSMPFLLNEPKQLKDARSGLKALVASALDPEHKVENPVTKARGVVTFEKTASTTEVVLRDGLAAMANRMEEMERRINVAVHGYHLSPLSLQAPSKVQEMWTLPPADDDALTIEMRALQGSRVSVAFLKEFFETTMAPAFAKAALIGEGQVSIMVRFWPASIPSELWGSIERQAKGKGYPL